MSVARNKHPCHIDNTIKRVDQFGKAIPSFNLKGEDKLHTPAGAFLSFLIILLMVLFGAIKALHLSNRHNPNVS